MIINVLLGNNGVYNNQLSAITENPTSSSSTQYIDHEMDDLVQYTPTWIHD
jgi:hypothetical protein